MIPRRFKDVRVSRHVRDTNGLVVVYAKDKIGREHKVGRFPSKETRITHLPKLGERGYISRSNGHNYWLSRGVMKTLKAKGEI